jgi:large subunit ribosomal protein L47
MASHITLRPALRHVVKSSTQSDLRLTFLLPSYATQSRNAPFSTSVPKTYPRDNNRQRGVSSIRRTGPRQPLSVSSLPLPVPVLDASKRSKIEVDPSHGLWDFFHSPEKPISTPEEDKAHGRHWTVEELRGKSWEDLWSLWWVCCKERNRISTENYERERIEAGYGSFEAKTREMTVRFHSFPSFLARSEGKQWKLIEMYRSAAPSDQ